MKKEKRLLVTHVALLSILSMGIAVAANVTQINRYATVENKPLASQINPLLTVQQIHFPQHVHTVGEALSYWLQYSGFAMVEDAQLLPALKDTLQQPLPQVVRNLGPLTVEDGVQVLVGEPVFSLLKDPLRRRINFKLKPQYAQMASKAKGAKT